MKNTIERQLNFLLTTWEGGGNMTPVRETARKLLARGHRVRVMSDECNRPEFESIGATFISWRRAPNRTDRSPGSQACRDWAAATPQEGLVAAIRENWSNPALAYAQDLIEELQRESADLVATCELLFGIMAGCESISQPFVNLCPNISLTPLPGIPPMGPGLPPARTEQDRAMHAEIAQASVVMFDSGLPGLNAARVALGLEPLAHLLDQFQAAEADLLATARAFDFPCSALPERVTYVGPQLGDPNWAQKWTSPWPASDRRPLVTVSFSTTFQNHSAVLQRVIDALERLPVRVLVTLGGAIKAEELKAAANCILVESAPHSLVMRESVFVINHGGHGTVMRALVSRAAMLVIPHGRDQNDNAVRVTERGAGLCLMPDAPMEAIRTACERLLTEAAFCRAAKELGDKVAAEAENSTVVHELESAALRACREPVNA